MSSHQLDLRGRLTVSVPEAGQLLGIGRDSAYAAAERGELECIEVGRRKVVPTHLLLRKVGWPDDLIARALGVDLDDEAGPVSPATATIHVLATRTSGDPHGAPTPAG